MKNRLFLLFVPLLFVHYGVAQNNVPNTAKTFYLGAEVQAYRAGQMYALRGELLLNQTSELNARLGYNIAFRQDFSGLNDNEQGGGLGFGLGYRYHISKGLAKNFFIGARCDLWQLQINWRDNDFVPQNGRTQITVVQPTAEAGYRLKIAANWRATVSVAFGQEINIITKGEAVGQGGISLIGATLSRKIL